MQILVRVNKSQSSSSMHIMCREANITSSVCMRVYVWIDVRVWMCASVRVNEVRLMWVGWCRDVLAWSRLSAGRAVVADYQETKRRLSTAAAQAFRPSRKRRERHLHECSPSGRKLLLDGFKSSRFLLFSSSTAHSGSHSGSINQMFVMAWDGESYEGENSDKACAKVNIQCCGNWKNFKWWWMS